MYSTAVKLYQNKFEVSLSLHDCQMDTMFNLTIYGLYPRLYVLIIITSLFGIAFIKSLNFDYK